MQLILAALFVYLYFILARVTYRRVCTKTINSSIKCITVILLVSIFFLDNICGNIAYYNLIKTKGGERVYEKVDEVPGFMIETGTGWKIKPYFEELFDGKYKYIELKVTKNNKEAGYAREKGFYRFYISNNSDKKCEDYWNDIKKNTNRGLINQFPSDKCIAYERENTPISKYMVLFDIRKEYQLRNVRVTSNVIQEISTGRTIAERSIVSYAGGFIKYSLYGYSQSELYPKINPDPDEINFIRMVLNK